MHSPNILLFYSYSKCMHDFNSFLGLFLFSLHIIFTYKMKYICWISMIDSHYYVLIKLCRYSTQCLKLRSLSETDFILTIITWISYRQILFNLTLTQNNWVTNWSSLFTKLPCLRNFLFQSIAKLCKDFQQSIHFRTCGFCIRDNFKVPLSFLDSHSKTLIQTLIIVIPFGFLTGILVSNLFSSQPSTDFHTIVSFFPLKHKYNHFIHSSKITWSLTKLSNLEICVKAINFILAITLLETSH